MVTQAPKRSAVFAALAFTLSCIGLMVFVWTQFGGTIPLRKGQGLELRVSGLSVTTSDSPPGGAGTPSR